MTDQCLNKGTDEISVPKQNSTQQISAYTKWHTTDQLINKEAPGWFDRTYDYLGINSSYIRLSRSFVRWRVVAKFEIQF